MRVTVFVATLAAMGSTAFTHDAAAQPWPARPVRVVVPYAPGGGADIVARVLTQKLSEQTGGTFVIDNRPGAGGIVGAELVARAITAGELDGVVVEDAVDIMLCAMEGIKQQALFEPQICSRSSEARICRQLLQIIGRPVAVIA